MSNLNKKEIISILPDFQKVISQITAASIFSTNEIALMEITLHHLMQALCLPKGMIKVNRHIRCKGITPDVSTKLNAAIEVDDEGFCTPVIVNNWKEHEGLFSHLHKSMESLSIQSSILVPVVLDQRNIGYCWLSSPEAREWKDDEVEFIKVINQILGITTEKLHFQQDTKSHANIIHRLNTISKTFNRKFAFDEALTVVGSAAVNLLEANHAAIFLKMADESITCPWQYALSETYISQIIEKEGKELSNFLLTTPSPILIPGHATVSLPDAFQSYLNIKGIRSSNLLPLIFDGNIVGSIGIFYDMPRESSLYEIDLMEVFATQAAVTLQNAYINDQLEKGYRDMALALADAMDKRSMMISEHSRYVAQHAIDTATLLGCTRDETQDIYWASLLHDIGKVLIPENVLQKQGPLTDDEWQLMQQYPLKGEELVQSLSQFENVGNIIRTFRERFDGDGYPNGLKGRKIPLGARVLAVVDAYETMISERPYQKSKSTKDAIDEIKKCSGKQFDPVVVEAFLRTIINNVNINMPMKKNDQA